MSQISTFQVYNASAGSGKTFTLVKAYLKILLQHQSPHHFKKVLAMTFTNKAALEMKERILHNLVSFSNVRSDDDKTDMYLDLQNELNLSTEDVRKKANQILNAILQNYAAFHISTIDSFTNKLVKSFAHDLYIATDFEVVLQPQELLTEAVDRLIAKIGIDAKLTPIMLRFAKEKTLEDKSWDITRELLEIADMLLNENDLRGVQYMQDKSIDDFLALQQILKGRQKYFTDKIRVIGEKGLLLIDQNAVPHNFFPHSELPNFFNKLIVGEPKELRKINFEGRLAKNIASGVLYSKSKKKTNATIISTIDSLTDSLTALFEEARYVFDQDFTSYYLAELILKQIIPVTLLSSIAKILDDIKVEHNIMFNAEFNRLISSYLIDQPAAFIYEKIGEKFQHFFIDEMQDTSVLQWQNLIPLIDNALAEIDSSALLVGDAKQAIYRWRGGKAEQFIALANDNLNEGEGNPFVVSKWVNNLETNYRSFSEVVKFNNSFFTYLADKFTEPAYQQLYKIGNHQKTNAKQGGYIHINLLPPEEGFDKEDQIAERIYQRILKLDQQFNRKDICILVRKKKHGVVIADYLTKKDVAIVSSETLLLKKSKKCQFIIHWLQYLEEEHNDEAKINSIYFLYSHLGITRDKHLFLNDLFALNQAALLLKLKDYDIVFSRQTFMSFTLNDQIEYIIKSFNLIDESDAYVQFFLDFVFEFTQKKALSNDRFLDYWEQKKDQACIVSSEQDQAVQIMTVHKSKGLEFKVVLFAFDVKVYDQINPKTWFQLADPKQYAGFDEFIVASTQALASLGVKGEAILNQQDKELELDHFNLLYVALTRAIEQLYIVLDYNTSKTMAYYSQFIEEFINHNPEFREEDGGFTLGNAARVSPKTTDVNNIKVQTSFCSTSWRDHQIHIATTALPLDDFRQEKIDYGTLIHGMLAQIITYEDVDKVIQIYADQGKLLNDEKEKVRNIIQSLVQHKQLKQYFLPNVEVVTEREIVNVQGETLIPDRLVLKQDRVTIIDYKTGAVEKKHERQINSYGDALRQMTYKIDKKLLVYLGDFIEVKEVLQ